MEYPYEKIEKIADRISKMKNKKYKNDLKQIKKIIESINPEIKENLTKNNNGYFLPDFEKYKYETYVELTKYLDKIEQRENSEKDDKTPESSSHVEHSEKNKKIKYTNSENHILNKLKYENELKKNSENETSQKDISELFKKTKKS